MSRNSSVYVLCQKQVLPKIFSGEAITIKKTNSHTDFGAGTRDLLQCPNNEPLPKEKNYNEDLSLGIFINLFTHSGTLRKGACA